MQMVLISKLLLNF